MIICLLGFMGCGKSSVGRQLARLLSCPFTDLDDYIEAREGMAVKDIFAFRGEAAFRQAEAECLREIVLGTGREEDKGRPDGDGSEDVRIPAQRPERVLALGGGTVMNPESAALVREKCVCVYLVASVDELCENLASSAATGSRPMLSGCSGENLKERISGLMAQRSGVYEATAHLQISSGTGNPAEVAELLLRAIKHL